MSVEIDFNEVVRHPGSSGHGAVLFFWNGELFRAPHKNKQLAFEKFQKAPIQLQPLISTDFILKHPKYGRLPVYKHNIIDHLVRINESVPNRAIDYLNTICDINIYLIEHGYVLCDIHEGNIYDTIDGIVWTDWGSIYSLKNNEDRKRPAASALALTLYLANKYIYKAVSGDHTQYSLVKAKQAKTPLKKVANMNGENTQTWVEIKNIIKEARPTVPTSHWSDNYALTANPETIKTSSAKGEPVVNLISEIEYDTLTDVACNKGYFTFFAAKKARSSVGLDIDEKCIHQAINNNKKIQSNIVFSKKDIIDLDKNVKLEKLRFSSDLVLALAIVHHIKKVMPHEQFANCLADMAKKYIIIEDVGTQKIYQTQFENRGFKLEKRLTSYPKERTISLYVKA